MFRKFCARMTHFGENTEYIEHDPVNLMVPSDLTKNVSILNYRPPKFQLYEKMTSQTQGKRLTKIHQLKPKEKHLLNFNTKTTYLTPKHYAFVIFSASDHFSTLQF